MSTDTATRRDAWISITIFLLIVGATSAVFHWALVTLNPTSLYVGPLMWMPAMAAFATLLIRGRSIRSLPWNWGRWRFNAKGFLVPVVYVGITYGLIYAFGLGGFPDIETIGEWRAETGLSYIPQWGLIAVMVALLGTVGAIRAMSTVVGEEIGWRGFLVWEMRKVMPFGTVALVTGLIWSFWHWPVVVWYGGGDALTQMTVFTIMITSMSVVMTYYTFKSRSLWPAVMFHAAHNVFIQKIFEPLTAYNDDTSAWSGEYGWMIAIVTAGFGLVYWFKARKEGL